MNTSANFHRHQQSAAGRLKGGSLIYAVAAVGALSVLMSGRGGRRVSAQDFPQAGDQSDSIEDVSGGIILPRANFPLIYSGGENLNALCVFEARTHMIIKSSVLDSHSVSAVLQLASDRRDEYEERRTADDIGVDFSQMRIMTILENWTLHYQPTDGAGSPELWALSDFSSNFCKIFRSQENPTWQFDDVRAAIESDAPLRDIGELVIWLDGEDAA